MRYVVVFEKTSTGYSVYSPDIPGCVSTGANIDQAERNMREAILFHFEGLKKDGLPIPEPISRFMELDIAVA